MGKGNNKVLVGVSIGLCAVMVGLLVAIGINLYQQNTQSLSDGNQDTKGTSQTSETDAAVLVKIAEYQTEIDAIKDTDTQAAAELYQERVFYLMDIENNENYAKYILADMIAIDDIEQSTGSAIDVINYADFFGDTELSAQYEEIFNVRKEVEGDLDGRG